MQINLARLQVVVKIKMSKIVFHFEEKESLVPFLRKGEQEHKLSSFCHCKLHDANSAFAYTMHLIWYLFFLTQL